MKALWVMAMAVVMATGCAQVDPTMHQVASDTSGEVIYLKTLDGRLGYHFWFCQRGEGREMSCDRLCDHDRYDHRLCAPEYHHEFGEISLPDSDLVAQRERRRTQDAIDEAVEEAVDEARDREETGPRREVDEDEEGDEEQIEEDIEDDEPSNGALP